MIVKFLTDKQILSMHDECIEQFGGSHGIRSRELFESAVYRMQASFDGQDLYASIFEKAAALLESLLLNHPFLDGNKRTAFVAIKVEKYIISIITDKKSPMDMASWLKRHSVKL